MGATAEDQKIKKKTIEINRHVLKKVFEALDFDFESK